MREDDSRHLGVAPDSTLTNRYGGKRQVSFLAEGPRTKCYVMALGSSGSFIEHHDRARLVFDDAAAPLSERASVIGPGARPRPWHLESLRDVSQVFEGGDGLWDRLAA